MPFGLSRRAFLQAVPFSLIAQQKKPKTFPEAGEFTRIVDAITENTIVRLTAPGSNSILAPARNHFVSSRERILVFSSDRNGHFAPFQVDLRSGALRQLADCANLDPRSLCLDRQEKTVRYLDGGALFEVGLNRSNPKQIAQAITAFGSALDGTLFFISGGKLTRNGRILADNVNDLWPQPNGAGCLFARTTGLDEQELYYTLSDGGEKPLRLASGRVREPYWDADGESIIFLRDVTAPNDAILAEIHGRPIRGETEHLVSPTSQLASFAPNTQATVFAGASRSKAQPNLLLTLREPHREMTLCEHRCSQPANVSPAFSPDNRRIYFNSDREGHFAIYSVNVELLIEPAP